MGSVLQYMGYCLLHVVLLLVFLARWLAGHSTHLQLGERYLRIGVDYCLGLLCSEGQVPVRGTGGGRGWPEGTPQVRYEDWLWSSCDHNSIRTVVLRLLYLRSKG